MAIRNFRDPRLEAILARRMPRAFPSDLIAVTRRKLIMLDSAALLADLRLPPANRLEALKGDRSGQYSIRVNDQYRICFRWTGDGAADVEFVDYH